MALAVLLLLATAARAAGEIHIVTTGQGQMTHAVEGGTCTLTATPAAGYCLTVADITVVRTVDGGHALLPRRAPDVADAVVVTAVNPAADPAGVTTYTFPMGDDDCDYEVTASFRQDDCLVRIGNISLNGVNTDVLDDGGSVQFDGRGMLVLSDADLTVAIRSYVDQLTVYLKGDNRVVTAGSALQGNGGELVFTTEGNTPGKLSLATTDGQPVVAGFTAVSYEQNLTVLSGAADSPAAEVGTPVMPIVDHSGETLTVTLGGDTDDYSNTVVGNVLYTLDAGHDDDVDPVAHYVVLGSTMIDDDVDAAISNYVPGTPDFAEHFAGLTFMVPAGHGRLLVNCRTGADGVLCVKVGSGEPYVISGALDFTDYSFPYACAEATYVYIYSSSPVESVAEAGHRAGKKTTVTVGIGSLGVSASEVQPSNGDSGQVTDDTDYRILAEGDVQYDEAAEVIVVNNPQVAGLPDHAFSDYGFVKYIDLRATSLRGLTVSRQDGPFAGVSANTFVFLSAGNSSSEPNVVVGSVCEQVVLDGHMTDEAFGLAAAFMAQRVELDRTYAADQLATVCLPFAIEASAASAFGTFYTYGGLQDGSVQMLPVAGDLKACEPYLFKSAAADTRLVAYGAVVTDHAPLTGSRAAAQDGLYGVFDYFYYDNSDVYRMTPVYDSQQPHFQRITSDGDVLPFEAYLLLNGVQAESLTIVGEGLTAISRLAADGTSADQRWYTLSGQRLQGQPTRPGLFVSASRKIVVR